LVAGSGALAFFYDGSKAGLVAVSGRITGGDHDETKGCDAAGMWRDKTRF